ncbi:GGDEF domain-containing protein [Colwellia psychrerythraea]|uniref:diguanylate cyclase n=1 Tax=Colwellia psychrerythraea TaxID=28229 RepID=A0A099KZ86_COLPS|nr:GGDEF domain-containing protein [Colwellia psychrerythraea]KGJ94963.1 diguanylate cyclase with integral membrane sensor [Colwellia psychrerythraea]
MNGSLSQRIYLFTLSCCLLFTILLGSVIWSSQTVELAFSRDSYAQQLDNQLNTLKQLVVSDNIYANHYSVGNWLVLQRKLTSLLKSSPTLTPQQKTIQTSIKSQNDSLKHLFGQITKNKLKNASVAIKNHLKARLMTQLEALRSDSLQLSAIAHKDIHNTIKHEALFIISVSAASIVALLFGAFTFTNIVSKSLDEVKRAFKQNHSGHFQKIRLSHRSQEFDSIVKAFNTMNEKLSETTVSLEVMKKVVEERTHVLEHLSNTDPLTKVANRRALFERANMEYSRAVRSNNKLTLLLLDCDLFKNVNDEFGHLFGDELLIHICKICGQEIRDIDFLARYGGEEFIIVLPNCDIAGGVETANRIQQSLAQHCIAIEDKEVFVTLSIGVSTLTERHKSLDQLINDADKAMYQAKDNGRNCIEVLTPSNLH